MLFISFKFEFINQCILKNNQCIFKSIDTKTLMKNVKKCIFIINATGLLQRCMSSFKAAEEEKNPN